MILLSHIFLLNRFRALNSQGYYLIEVKYDVKPKERVDYIIDKFWEQYWAQN